ncbi:MAG TPA: hypothetical protein VF904_16315, partial [Anaeromyxobacteraceae bacterium]
WLGACERWMSEGERDVERMVSHIAPARNTAALHSICSDVPPYDFVAADPWGLIEDTDKLLRAGDVDGAATAALDLTLAVLNASEKLVPSAGSLSKFASTGGAQRIAIPFFLAWWRDRHRFRLGGVTAEMLTELVLEQHSAVAMARFDGKNRRLRFGKDEHGWMLLPGTTPTVPTLTPDRIAAMLALLEDLALVDRVTRDACRVTALGAAVLKRVEALWSKQPNAGAA